LELPRLRKNKKGWKFQTLNAYTKGRL
jgi:hypothetical protein